MADPLSLAFGIAGLAGLAGLFSTCLDVIDRVESHKYFGFDSRSISSQLEADKMVFRRWAQKVGIGDRGLEADHHKCLDDPEIVAMVERLLSSIQEIFSATDTTSLAMNQSFQADLPQSRARPHHHQLQQASRRDKTRWALKGKTKFIDQVQRFGALVQRLLVLVPPDRDVGGGADGNIHREKGKALNEAQMPMHN